MRRNWALFLLSLTVLILFPGSGKSSDINADEFSVSAEIDRILEEAWKKEKLVPSGMSNDAEFLRRVSIDITGQLPSPDEVLKFTSDTSTDKRKKKIDELLESPFYAKHWATWWQAWLIGREFRRRFEAVYRSPFQKWLEEEFKKNTRYDLFVQKLLTAQGQSDTNPETIYLLRWNTDAATVAGKTMSLFMGIRLQCAQCHDHPYEKWKQTEFWGMTSFFTRVRRQEVRGADNKIKAYELFEGRRGEGMLPNTTKVVPPKFIINTTPKMEDKDNRRDAFTKLLISPDNPYFGRALVNRMWAHFFGRGIFNPIDDYGETSKPLHPELLDLLTNDFVRNGFDLKRLVRMVTNTKTYQLSSKYSDNNQKDKDNFSKALLRPLSPEQLFDALMRTVGVEDILRARQKTGKSEDLEKFLANALQRFVIIFDNDEMNEALDYEGTIQQALFMMNSRFTQELLLADEGNLTKILNSKKSPDERIDAMFLASLSRLPVEGERKKFQDFISSHGNNKDAYKDLFWVLLNTSEFFFNH